MPNQLSDEEVTEANQLKGAETSGITDGSGSTIVVIRQEHNAEAVNGGDDASRSSDTSSTTSGESAKSDGQIEHSEGVDETSSSATYEGVTATDFDDYSEAVLSRLDGLTASAVVILFALFVCVGILLVNEILVSLRGR